MLTIESGGRIDSGNVNVTTVPLPASAPGQPPAVARQDSDYGAEEFDAFAGGYPVPPMPVDGTTNGIRSSTTTVTSSSSEENE